MFHENSCVLVYNCLGNAVLITLCSILNAGAAILPFSDERGGRIKRGGIANFLIFSNQAKITWAQGGLHFFPIAWGIGNFLQFSKDLNSVGDREFFRILFKQRGESKFPPIFKWHKIAWEKANLLYFLKGEGSKSATQQKSPFQNGIYKM